MRAAWCGATRVAVDRSPPVKYWLIGVTAALSLMAMAPLGAASAVATVPAQTR